MFPETAKRLRDAQAACIEVATFVEGNNLDSFLDNRGLQLILQALFSNIGEALNRARGFDVALEGTLSDLHRIVGMRNRIVHGYDTIDYDVLWFTAIDRVPNLLSALDELLRDAPDPNEGFAKE